MNASYEQALIEVWPQALVENAKAVKVGGESYLFVGLRSAVCDGWISFSTGTRFEGWNRTLIPRSRWAQLARSGKKVMQFLSEGRYVANVVDGKVTRYGKA